MISHQHKVIFIHIPKCAGTSIEAALGHHDVYSGRYRQDHRTIRHLERPIGLSAVLRRENRQLLKSRFHLRRKEYKNPRNALTVNSKQFRRYYKFTVIRDPWSRVHSYYRNVMRDELKLMKHGGELDFESFVERYAGHKMLAPIGYWIDGFSGTSPLDRVVRFERLAEDLSEVANEASLPMLRDLPHLLPSGSHQTMAQDYTEKSRRIVAERYATEIQRFDFSCPV